MASADWWNWGEWGLKEDKWKGVLSWSVRWACRAGTTDYCTALAALVCPVQNICFLTVDFFNAFVRIAGKLGRQPCWVACLLVCVSAGKIYGVLVLTSKYPYPPVQKICICRIHYTYIGGQSQGEGAKLQKNAAESSLTHWRYKMQEQTFVWFLQSQYSLITFSHPDTRGQIQRETSGMGPYAGTD